LDETIETGDGTPVEKLGGLELGAWRGDLISQKGATF